MWDAIHHACVVWMRCSVWAAIIRQRFGFFITLEWKLWIKIWLKCSYLWFDHFLEIRAQKSHHDENKIMKASNEVQSVPGLSVQLCPTLCYWVNCNLPSPLSMDFSKQEYWSRLPFPNSGNLSSSGIEPASVALLHWQADSLSLSGGPSNQLTLWKQIQNLLRGISQVFSLKVSEKKLCMCVCLISGSPTLQAYSLPSELPGKPK